MDQIGGVKNITRRVIYGVSSNVIAQMVNVLIQFAGVPLLLKYWGPAYYGEWLIMFTIPSFIENADFGLGGSATTEMSMLKEAGDLGRVKEILRSVFWFILLVGGIPFLLLYLSSWFVSWHDFLHLEHITAKDFNLAFPCLIAYVYLTLFLTIPVGYYRVEKVYHRERYIAVAFKLMEFGGLCLVVFTGHGVVEAALTYLVIKVCFFIVVFLDLSFKFQEFRIGFFSLHFSKIRHLFKPSLALMIIFIGQNMLIQGITTTIGIVLGPIQVVIFNTTRTLMNMAKQVVNIVNLSFISEFSYAHGQGNKALLGRLYQKVQWTNMGISFVAIAAILILGHRILEFWTNGKIDIVQPFFFLFGVSVFFNGFWSGGLILLVATNNQFKTGIYFLSISAAILLVIILFLKSGGLTLIASMLVVFEILMILVISNSCKQTLEIATWNCISLKRVRPSK